VENMSGGGKQSPTAVAGTGGMPSDRPLEGGGARPLDKRGGHLD